MKKRSACFFCRIEALDAMITVIEFFIARRRCCCGTPYADPSSGRRVIVVTIQHHLEGACTGTKYSGQCKRSISFYCSWAFSFIYIYMFVIRVCINRGDGLDVATGYRCSC